MKKNTLLAFAILSGILLALPWYNSFSGIISSIAFVPLLIIEDYLYKTRKTNDRFGLYKYSILSFFIWNIIASYWIIYSDFLATTVVICTNTIAMTLVFGLFHITKRKFGNKIGNFSLIVYWISFEYIFLHAHLTWPWLNLGNAFTGDIKLIQWYEYTGTLGGTLWVLILNLAFFKTIKSYFKNKNLTALTSNTLVFILCLMGPILISKYIFKNYKETGKNINIAVVQPNVDPYQEKYEIPQVQQLNTIIDLADNIIDQNTNYVIAPETAISNPIWENDLATDSSILRIKELFVNYPDLTFIIGANTFKRIENNQEISACTKYNNKDKFHYNAYNAALQLDTTNQIPIYYKSKLVSGVETMPFLKTFGFLEKIFFDFGGITGSICSQKERSVFYNSKLNISIAPVICYESAFGEHVSDFIKKDADLIFILTNDGWWGNSPGYKQHFRLSQLRAIETRRSIARCANTGISAFINQRGEIIKKTKYWIKDAINNTLHTNTEITFYVKYGDYIGRLSIFIAILLILYTFVQYQLNPDQKINK